MQSNHRKSHVGIVVKHRTGCATLEDRERRCNCRPRYQASVWIARGEQRIRRHFDSLRDAQAWREEARGRIRKGQMRAPTRTTLGGAAVAWLEGARDGSVRNRSGDRYKPSALRGYARSLERVGRDLGARKLADVSRNDLQDLADRMLARGASPSAIRNELMPLRAIYRRAVARGDVAVNPTSGLELPAVRDTRDRITSPPEAARLVAAAPDRDRALWATAFYAGPRRGELMALRVADVDLRAGVIRVERSWDPVAGPVAPKSRAGRRAVPIPAVLRAPLAEYLLAAGRSGDDLAFGRTAERPFDPSTVYDRARKAWEAAGLEPIGLHDARHTFASICIAAGVNAKALSTYMGHASITITLDRYGHLFPGSGEEAADLLDAYLQREPRESRSAPGAPSGGLSCRSERARARR